MYRFSRDDDLTLRFVAVNLRLDGHAKQREIAQAFGHSIRTQMRWEKWYREEGLAGLEEGVRTGRPRGVDGGNRVFLAKWFEQEVSNREIARRLGVSEATVRRELSRLGLSRSGSVSDQLFGEEQDQGGDTNSVDEEPRPIAVPPGTLDTDPLNRVLDRSLARCGLLEDATPFFAEAEQLPRAGVLLAVPLLAASGALAVFERIYGSLGAAFYGLRSTVVCLFLMALLRIKYPENLKEHPPSDLGRIMGLDRMPEVKTLRRKLGQLGDASKGEELMRGLAQLRIEDDVERVGYIYLDGHVREYHGKHRLGKAHITGKRISAPAATDTWVNDVEGDPLFVVTSELNAGLTQVLPQILAEVRGMVEPDRQVTVVFDRGGYSPKLFAELKEAGFDLITYRKGTKDPVALKEFREVQLERGGKKETWRIHDKAEVPVGVKRKATDEKEAEPWLVMRQVSRLREDGQSVTQVLTTHQREDLAAEEVLIRMFSRWRQENFFKYMKAEFALDALTEYGVEDLSEEADRPNPERKKLTREREKGKAKLMKLLSQLGEEVERNEESRRRTVRGLKISNAKLRGEIAEVTREIEDLSARIKGMPARVKADQLRRLKRDRKLVVDAVKMVAHQVESDLHRMLFGRYQRADDEGRTLLHAIFQSPARLEIEDKELKVTIAGQSSPHRTRVLKELCDEMNKLNVNFPGSDLRIVLAAECPEHAIA